MYMHAVLYSYVPMLEKKVAINSIAANSSTYKSKNKKTKLLVFLFSETVVL